MNSEVIISPYEEWEKRVINGKVQNVVYHATDWQICFGNKGNEKEQYVHKTLITPEELKKKVKALIITNSIKRTIDRAIRNKNL